MVSQRGNHGMNLTENHFCTQFWEFWCESFITRNIDQLKKITFSVFKRNVTCFCLPIHDEQDLFLLKLELCHNIFIQTLIALNQYNFYSVPLLLLYNLLFCECACDFLRFFASFLAMKFRVEPPHSNRNQNRSRFKHDDTNHQILYPALYPARVNDADYKES